jgi:hypothetical protein
MNKTDVEPEGIDILWMELSQQRGYWLSPQERFKDKLSEIRQRHRAKYLAEKEKERKQKRWQRLRREAEELLARTGFDPDEPRDPHGRWSSGGGTEDEDAEAGKPEGGKHPGPGYSKDAYEKDGIIYTGNVADAAKALGENRKVELDQPRELSVLIDRLGAISKHMIAMGEKAPTFNLCNVMLEGTSLFCVDSKGIPRVEMPQMTDKQTKEFREYLKDKGYKVKKEEQFAAYLRATQNELNGAKVAGIAEKLRGEPDHYAKRIIVSKDDYILDGHHHWAAKVGLDAEDNNLTNDTKVRIARVNIPITKLLEEAEKFTGGKGKVGMKE